MKHKDILGIIPEQFKGQQLEAAAAQTLTDSRAAQTLYQQARNKLLQVNSWHTIAGTITANFQIIDADGKEVNRDVKKGDYLRVDIPGPGNKEGDGYDWVLVEDLREINKGSLQSMGFRVRPNDNPFSDKNETAHFYSEDTTSSFIVMREDTTVFSWIVDRNLLPNTDQSSLVDKIRDTIVGISGIAGFSKAQWQGLADGLLSNKTE